MTVDSVNIINSYWFCIPDNTFKINYCFCIPDKTHLLITIGFAYQRAFRTNDFAFQTFVTIALHLSYSTFQKAFITIGFAFQARFIYNDLFYI